jgi:hypothetical protein
VDERTGDVWCLTVRHLNTGELLILNLVPARAVNTFVCYSLSNEPAGLIRSSADDAPPLGATANDDRLAAKLRPIALLD